MKILNIFSLVRATRITRYTKKVELFGQSNYVGTHFYARIPTYISPGRGGACFDILSSVKSKSIVLSEKFTKLSNGMHAFQRGRVVITIFLIYLHNDYVLGSPFHLDSEVILCIFPV